MKDIVISGTGLFTPSQSISNDDLVVAFNAWVRKFNEENKDAIAAGEIEAEQESGSEFIVKASGIQSRYVIDREGILDPDRMYPRIPERPDEEDSLQCEMGKIAGREALERAGKKPEDVDAVFVACSNMQRPYPAMAIELQNALGCGGYAFDLNVACSSATFGILTAANAVRTGSAKAALVISPEICSGHLNFKRRDSHFIFGDACTAVLIEAADTCTVSGAFEILGTKAVTQYSNNIRNNFGFLNRCDESGIGKDDKLFVQNGRQVFREVCPMVADLIGGHLEELGLAPDAVKRFWLHQANLGMNQLIAKKLLGKDAPEDKTPVILDEYANTSSAGSIIAFHKYHDDFASGDLGVICSFGAGYSIGSVVVRKK